ncbi:hypothetical protein CL634_07645, partial [bacterium]|nr:hypothetical protein [bacterium]
MADPRYFTLDSTELDKDYLIQDEEFMADVRQFLGGRKDYSLRDLRDPEQAYNLFVRHMRHSDINEVAAVNDLRHVNEIDDAGKVQMGKLYSVWDRMDSGGTSILRTMGDYGLGVATAPSTYAGIITAGAGKLIGAGGLIATRIAAREAAVGAFRKSLASGALAVSEKLPTHLAKRRAITGGLEAAAIEGSVGAITGAAGEETRVRADITGEREFSWARPVIQTGVGAVAGGVLGGGVGAFSGWRQMAALGLHKEATENMAKAIGDAHGSASTILGTNPAAAGLPEFVSSQPVRIENTRHIINTIRTLHGQDPIPVEDVIAGRRLGENILADALADIPDPVWKIESAGKHTTELGFYRTDEGTVVPTRIGAAQQIPVFAEINRIAPNEWQVSTGTRAGKLSALPKTYESLDAAKADFKTVLNKQGLLPSASEEFALKLRLEPDAAADSIQHRVAAAVIELLERSALATDAGGEPTLTTAGQKITAPREWLDFSKVITSEDGKELYLGERITTFLMRAVRNMATEEQSAFFGDIFEKYGITAHQFSQVYAAELSAAGTVLGYQSVFKAMITKAIQAGKGIGVTEEVANKNIREFQESLPELADIPVRVKTISATGKETIELQTVGLSDEGLKFVQAMEGGENTVKTFLRANASKGWSAAGGWIKEFDAGSKGLLTMQLATTMRNAENATLRTGLYMMTNLLQGTFETAGALARKNGGDSPEVQEAMIQGLARMQAPIYFLKNLFDPQEAKGIFIMAHRTMPKEYGELVRELADVEGAMGGGMYRKFARKMNALNTFIDNFFKRTVYVTELGIRIGHKNLREMYRTGNFAKIEARHQIGAMDASLDFVYQKKFTRPHKREVLVHGSPTIDWNWAGDKFVKFFSIPIVGSGIIPFPRFVASMLNHAYEYSPFLGMVPLEKLGYRRKLPTFTKKLRLKVDTERKIGRVQGQKLKNMPEETFTPEEASVITQRQDRTQTVRYTTAEKKLLENLKTAKVLTPEGLEVKGKKFGLIRPGRSREKIMAQQVVGSALLYGAIQLRAAQGPESAWYEIRKLPGAMGTVSRGMYADARAWWGAYAPYAFVADMLLRSNNWLTTTGKDDDEITKWIIPNDAWRTNMERAAQDSIGLMLLDSENWFSAVEATFGSTFKAGQGLFLADDLAREWQAAGTLGTTSIARMGERFMYSVGPLIANYMVRPVVPMGMVKDVLGTVDPLWKAIPEDADVNPMLAGAYGDAKRRMIGIITRPIPKREGKLFGIYQPGIMKGFERSAVTPASTRIPTTEGGILKQLTGLGAGRYKNILQEEFTRLHMTASWKLFQRFKNPILDRVADKYTATDIATNVLELLRSGHYVTLETDDLKRQYIRNRLAEVRKRVNNDMIELVAGTGGRAPADPEMAELKLTDRRAHTHLVQELLKVGYQNRFSRLERKIIEDRIKTGALERFGYEKGTVLSAVRVDALNEDGTPKYTLGQLRPRA